jgi:hypothetical protein
MTNKIDLGQIAKNNGRVSVSMESAIETQARIDREKLEARAKLIRSNVDVALLVLVALACLYYGMFDLTDPQRTTWSRTALFAIVSYLVGRHVGKNDSSS